MSKNTKMYAGALVFCVLLILVDTYHVVEFGGFVNGLALFVVVFAILAFVSAMKDRKANNG